MTAAQALEAAQMGRVSCYCMVNGTRREIIRSNPKATTEQLLKAAGIGAGSTSGAMVIAWLIYMLVSKVKSSAQNKLPPTPRPRKVKPSRRKSLGSAFT
ncbi:Hypothetical predicted protein [Mytilus galloprovincialis]|uniref:Uncharacterized protein n=1 Tax=Mytilus galloprovincialis TaxID=29158 RepID=A0A8B6EMA3_MYTGA|nr:Hypothetical predicted protein [Mytilus galloprovincialis]